ncbi:hypothetical protein RJ639_002360 [Escallonia herrerae]|uniref:Pentatricopeptide repeat-containing protein n=1 Tax=Escallonia herrerae TaxID=1293975 RepID=A0AA89BFW8_9ASTE|nr:hypothetical protein RJ639_002360 [Escallonia herrerae]
MGQQRLVKDKTYCIALKTLASAREIKRCVEFFHLMDVEGYGYNVETSNKVLESLCRCKLVVEAKYVMIKLKDCVRPNEITYKWLVFGYCDVGDLVEASKTNRFDEAMKLLQSIRSKRMDELGVSTYRLVIKWMSKERKIGQAHVMFDDMRERGIAADVLIMASLVYGLSSLGRVRGLLRLRRAGEATYVFREMIRRGCEPTMHTYVMLLHGHLGRRGRKGSDPLVNFDTIFVGELVKAGKSLEATKYVDRVIDRGLGVPRFDYN